MPGNVIKVLKSKCLTVKNRSVCMVYCKLNIMSTSLFTVKNN